MTNRLKLIVILLFTGLCGCIFLLNGNSNKLAAQNQEKTAEEVYRNIKVFNGLPASQLLGAMNFMAGSLGVSCTHCHVANQFSKDDRAAKQTAREHILMMRAVNEANFGGKTVTNCATCHRGETRPGSVVTLAQNQLPPATEALSSTESLPTVEQILDKYIQAMGGRKKIDKLQTLTIRGTRETKNGTDSPSTEHLEIYRKTPNKLLLNFTSSGNSSSQAFNGTAGWRRSNGRVSPIGGAYLLCAKRDADFYKDVNFKEQYRKLEVIRKENVGGHRVFVIEATFAETHPARTMFGIQSEKLFFDAQSGYLIRRFMEYRTPLGGLPEATDYVDYRKINGVMFPFTVRLSRPPLIVTQKFLE